MLNDLFTLALHTFQSNVYPILTWYPRQKAREHVEQVRQTDPARAKVLEKQIATRYEKVCLWLAFVISNL